MWLDRTGEFRSLDKLWCRSPCMCAPRKRLLHVAGPVSALLALMRKYRSVPAHTCRCRILSHTGCSERAGLTAAAFVQEQTQKTTPKMQWSDTAAVILTAGPQEGGGSSARDAAGAHCHCWAPLPLTQGARLGLAKPGLCRIVTPVFSLISQ